MRLPLDLGAVSIARAVVAAAGEAPPAPADAPVPALARALVFAEVQVARALAQHGFRVILVAQRRRMRAYERVTPVRARPDALPIAAGGAGLVVGAGWGGALRGAAADSLAAAERVQGWIEPLARGGRLVLIDRIDGGLLGTRPTVAREDLCAALLGARLRDVAQAMPRAGTVITWALVTAATDASSLAAAVPATADGQLAGV